MFKRMNAVAVALGCSLVLLGCSGGTGSSGSGSTASNNTDSGGAKAQTDESFVNFETPHVRPLALGSDSKQLFAVNTPDNRLTIYNVTSSGLALAAEVPVGLEPVSVAVHQNKAGHSEAWVVNHLSDSVSIVDVDPVNPGLSHVTRTLLVGDEPRDIVFAGKSRDRAFISAAHRGQNRPGDPQLSTQGIGRADVWTFDMNNLGSVMGGTPLSIVPLFGDTPRALAVSPDGGTVYAAVFQSGNRTTTIPESIVSDNGGMPPPPSGSTPDAPEVGLIVRVKDGKWLDEIGRDWTAFVPFSLPDRDVFTIDANGSPPASLSTTTGSSSVLGSLASGGSGTSSGATSLPLPLPTSTSASSASTGKAQAGLSPTQLRQGLPASLVGLPAGSGSGSTLPLPSGGGLPGIPGLPGGSSGGVTDTPDPGSFAGVGTVLFNMAVRPDNGAVYVSNTEARNEVRFAPMMKGQFAQNRITVIKNGVVKPVHLNPHINYAVATGPQSEIDQSLASPTDMVFSPDGHKVYVAGFSSAKVGVYDTDKLEAGQIQKTLIPVGNGPSGLALDATAKRLYVMNRLDASISIVSLDSNQESQRVALPYDPTPLKVRQGRPFLYDARISSGHGDLSCHTCHVFGDNDGLAWDLGDPFGKVLPNPNVRNPAATGLAVGGAGPAGAPGTPFHPMKGPMTTQSLRGLTDAGPMHWRGDKTGGLNPDGTVNPDPNAWHNEDLAFKEFNGAFTDLQGTAAKLNDDQMEKYTNFALTLRYPPNPIMALDNTQTAQQAAGEELFKSNDLIPVPNNQGCASCHVLPLSTNGAIAQTADISGTQLDFKIPHLRNAYTKVGMFGAAKDTLFIAKPAGVTIGYPPVDQTVGNQIRGFGFTHDGSVANIFLFLQHPMSLFSPIPNASSPTQTLTTDEKRHDIEAFILSLDTGLRPAVGQQVTINSSNSTDATATDRLNLLVARADAGDCDLVVKGVRNGVMRGGLYAGGGKFTTDRKADPTLDVPTLMDATKTAGQEQTFTCVPPGTGKRIAVDRNLDGVLDQDAAGP